MSKEAILDPEVIDYIKKEKERKRQQEDSRRPRIETPIRPPAEEDTDDSTDRSDRGVTIINPDGTESDDGRGYGDGYDIDDKRS